MSEPSDPQAAAALSVHRRHYLRRFGAVLALLALASVIWWWAGARSIEQTDDAYVAGEVVQVSPRVAGIAISVLAQNTDWVETGTPLVEIDNTDAHVALDAALDELAHAVRNYRSASADAAREHAQIVMRESDLARSEDDLQRRLELAADGGVAREDLRHARNAMTSAQAALDAQRAAYRASLAHVDGTTIATNPLVKAAAAQVRNAALALARTEVRAPIAGRVTRRLVQVGQHVAPGVPVMEIVPLDRVWVDANFKESQLRYIHAGLPVELHADLYGSDIVYHGTVEGFEAGTGAAFAAMPAQNATGNWIKVVQRVPVRIALDANELHVHPLLIGLSMSAAVHVNTGSQRGDAMANTMNTAAGTSTSVRPRRVPETTRVYAYERDAGEALIAQTIRANGAGAGEKKKATP
ncbi:HlyD family efflux transporter periplasmic adaptor subunit [Trinickia sp. LjRoot230]|uniref:HlyD family efflux transporter periplasmic adaptor subunit n=1 Tax=Trinickia sp. LjRoot230 TaxID=3342288 RepID=UPI003ED0710C